MHNKLADFAWREEVAPATIVIATTGLALMIAIQVLVVFWALKCRLGRENSLRVADVEEGDGRVVGLSAREVADLPCHELKEGDGGECAVCLEAFRAGDRFRVLPACEHGVHAECVDSWLRSSRRCTLCRAEVVTQGKSAGAAVEEAASMEIVVER